MSLIPSRSSSSSITFSSTSSLINSNEGSMTQNPLSGSDLPSLSSAQLPQIDGEQKNVSTSSKLRNNESSGRHFLSVRKNVGLLKSNSIEDKRIRSGN